MVEYGGVLICRESGVRPSVCVRAFGRILASVVLKVFSRAKIGYTFVFSMRFETIIAQ